MYECVTSGSYIIISHDATLCGWLRADSILVWAAQALHSWRCVSMRSQCAHSNLPTLKPLNRCFRFLPKPCSWHGPCPFLTASRNAVKTRSSLLVLWFFFYQFTYNVLRTKNLEGGAQFKHRRRKIFLLPVFIWTLCSAVIFWLCRLCKSWGMPDFQTGVILPLLFMAHSFSTIFFFFWESHHKPRAELRGEFRSVLTWLSLFDKLKK